MARPTPATSVKPSRIKRNVVIVVIVVLIVGAVAAATSRPSPEAPNQTTTPTELTPGSTLQLRQRYIMKTGSDTIPVMVTFSAVWFQSSREPDYKQFVLEIQVKNTGTKETSLFGIFASKWELTVDKGYIYDSKNYPYFSIRPEEAKNTTLTFEILKSTVPSQLRYYDACLGSTAQCQPAFILDLQGATIPIREELSIGQNTLICIMSTGKQSLNVTNVGLASVSVTAVLVNGQTVYTGQTQINSGQTVTIRITVPDGVRSSYELMIVTAGGSAFKFSCYP